jgi:excinuclease UvrABC ATPase subunit
MNQDQVKQKLLQLEKSDADFIVTFSGKKSKKVDGLYYPDRREMIIHNHNFVDDNQLMYTAIHEYAHHLQFAKTNAPVSARSHTIDFWNIFHSLLYKAEKLKIYNNIFDANSEFKELTARLQNDYLSKNGSLMKELGSLLVKGRELCIKYHVSFEDYLDRVLQLHRNDAKTIIKTYTMDISPKIGYENMKTVSRISDAGLREEVQGSFLDKSKSPDMIKAEIHPKKEFSNRLSYLEAEKERVERLLNRFTEQLTKLEREIDNLKKEEL